MDAIRFGLICVFTFTMVHVSAADTPIAEDVSVSRAGTEALVKRDLAQRLKVQADQVKVLDASDRTWHDPTFGCSARKGLGEPTPIPGFAFTLACGGKQYVYHADRSGHIRRCDTVKPVAPIVR
jgi:hypothetical protein